ncbi:beta-N-acetylhexosaminidase [Oceanospirillaceae bacterium ASx5O]|nr:beta-N-acetylhexosaminidase [Oceanospirillaceae bacterium ASx5O]
MPQSLTHAIGVIADLAGPELTSADHDFLQQPELCGLIFFARNYQSPQQLQELTAAIRELRPDLLLCADQEGGRVQRFRTGFTRLPPMLTLEQIYHRNPPEALELAQELGWLMAAEVRACGVHLSFAPVLDIERDVSRVIGDRAFGHAAETVTRLAGAFIAGMQQAGMAAVGKHFPGHGAVAADSHLALPVDERPWPQLQTDIAPFAALIQSGLLAGIMPAHVVYPAVDAQYTAGFSALWLQEILRRQLQFGGLIFSDDLSMAGAASAGDYAGRAQAAAAAGANALLVCNDRVAAQQVIDAARGLRAAGEFTALSLAYLQGPATTVVDAARQQQIRQRLAALWQE